MRNRTFEGLEALKHLDDAMSADQVRVLCRRLHNNLQVLPDVDLEHLLEAFERLVDGKATKVVDQELCSGSVP